MTPIQLVDEIPPSVEEKMRADLVRYESNHGIDVRCFDQELHKRCSFSQKKYVV